MSETISVNKDRYDGTYSRQRLNKDGAFTAWNCPEGQVPEAPAGDDESASNFWLWVKETRYAVGIGNTAEEAVADLISQIQSNHASSGSRQPQYLGAWLPG